MSKWNGTGLPPVGEVCEVTWGYKFGYVECVYHGLTQWGDFIFELTDSETVECKEGAEFRPLKSEADRKQGEAVEHIAGIIAFIDARTAAELLYSAGYRKVTPLTDEGKKYLAECFRVQGWWPEGLIDAVEMAIMAGKGVKKS